MVLLKSVVDADCLWQDLMDIAQFTDPQTPYTRRVFSPLFVSARKWLAQRFTDCGLATHTDFAGNLIGRLKGSDENAGTIMIGSHCDTVEGGGRFDGIAGVIAALEIGRSFLKHGFKSKHNLEIVDFLGEEPNVFGLSCVGSRAMSGLLQERMLGYSDSTGDTLRNALERVGAFPDRIADSKRSDVKAFFELHIEQGPILEKERIDIGLVTAIVGIRRIEITFIGEADHAGTTPMNLRRDASVAMAETVSVIHKLAKDLSQAGEGHFVATTGVIEVQPNAANVVPQRARLLIDARSESQEMMERFYADLEAATAQIAHHLNVELDGPNIVSNTTPATCDESLRSLLGTCARDLGFSTCQLASGAGHDAAFISHIAPAAMVFVPCRRGKSHAAEEWAEPEALAKGANTIAEAIMRFDQSSD